MHISNDLLTRYAIYLEDSDNPDYDGKRLSFRQMNQIKHHIVACDLCGKQLQSVRQEFRIVLAHAEEAGLGTLSTHEGSQGIPFNEYRRSSKGHWLEKLKVPKTQIAAAFGLILLVLAVSFYYQTQRQPYNELAVIHRPEIEFEVRSGISDAAAEALRHYQKDHYEEAATTFERLLLTKTNKEWLPFVHYYAGLSYLLASDKKILGLIYDFDQKKVQNGIKHLQEVERLTQNIRYREDAHWYLAKAHLRLQDYQSAIEELHNILQFPGTRTEAAKELIEEVSRVKNH